MVVSSRTSTLRTERRFESMSSRPCRQSSRVLSRSLRAVATMGRVVVWRRWRVSARPMPREEGVVRSQGEGMARRIGGAVRLILQPSTL